MKSIVPMNPVDWQSKLPTKDQIGEMDAEQLVEVLKLCGRLSDVILQVAAWAWAALEERGVDLDEILEGNPYLFRRVRDIAHERLSVEAAMKFGGNSYVLDYVRKLSREQQDRLVSDDRVSFVVEENRQLTERRLHLAALNREQLKQLVDERGELRTPNQQRAYLSPSPLPADREERSPAIVISRVKMRIGNGPEAPLSKVIKAMREKGVYPIEVKATA